MQESKTQEDVKTAPEQKETLELPIENDAAQDTIEKDWKKISEKELRAVFDSRIKSAMEDIGIKNYEIKEEIVVSPLMSKRGGRSTLITNFSKGGIVDYAIETDQAIHIIEAKVIKYKQHFLSALTQIMFYKMKFEQFEKREIVPYVVVNKASKDMIDFVSYLSLPVSIIEVKHDRTNYFLNKGVDFE